MSTRHHYFAYKTGQGNCFERLAPERRGEEGYLYVGFSDVLEHDGKDDGHIVTWLAAGGEKKYRPHKTLKSNGSPRGRAADDAWIAWFLHEANRSQTVLVCFFQTHFCFFRPLSSDLVLERKGSDPSDLWKRAVEAGRDAYKNDWPADGPPLLKLMRVEFLHRVPRSELYTAVDSLSGDRNVIQRTSPPLWRVKGSDLDAEETLHVGKQVTPGAESAENETGFGTFLRLYFNGLLREVPGFEDEPTLAHPRGPKAETQSSPDWRGLASKTFNPILLETAAYYFCLDLGGHDEDSGHARLLPDVGVGKGLSVIDVRARVRPDTDANRRDVAEALRVVARSGRKPLDEEHPAVERLKDSGVLELQCKAARAKLDPRNKALVFFGHGGDAGEYAKKRAQILFDELLPELHQNPRTWPHLNAFMDMQAENLRRSAGHP